jgi:hypothetical protein
MNCGTTLSPDLVAGETAEVERANLDNAGRFYRKCSDRLVSCIRRSGVPLTTLIADTRKAVADDAGNARAVFSAHGTLVGLTEVDICPVLDLFRNPVPVSRTLFSASGALSVPGRYHTRPLLGILTNGRSACSSSRRRLLASPWPRS